MAVQSRNCSYAFSRAGTSAGSAFSSKMASAKPSSIACPAPWPKCGTIEWATSPSRGARGRSVGQRRPIVDFPPKGFVERADCFHHSGVPTIIFSGQSFQIAGNRPGLSD